MQTPDGRDLTTTEWRPIPELPKYEITPDGDVRNRRNRRLVNETHNKRTGAYYYVLRREMPDGTSKNVTRNYRSLLNNTYPENEGT